MIIVFTGNGKGKTTAALGQAMRVMGRGKRALMIQFIKGPWRSGEDEFVEKLKTQKGRMLTRDQKLMDGAENIYDFDIRKMGLGFVGILGDKLPRANHAKAAENALKHFRDEFLKGIWHLIVLDEINVAISLGLIKVSDVVPLLKKVPEESLVILTGRDAPKEFIEVADLVTEVREIKHPFMAGTQGKKLVEF